MCDHGLPQVQYVPKEKGGSRPSAESHCDRTAAQWLRLLEVRARSWQTWAKIWSINGLVGFSPVVWSFGKITQCWSCKTSQKFWKFDIFDWWNMVVLKENGFPCPRVSIMSFKLSQRPLVTQSTKQVPESMQRGERQRLKNSSHSFKDCPNHIL